MVSCLIIDLAFRAFFPPVLFIITINLTFRLEAIRKKVRSTMHFFIRLFLNDNIVVNMYGIIIKCIFGGLGRAVTMSLWDYYSIMTSSQCQTIVRYQYLLNLIS